jgi:hypothetical protein
MQQWHDVQTTLYSSRDTTEHKDNFTESSATQLDIADGPRGLY